TYLALTFGTLLSSQGTDTSFRPLSQALRAFRSFVSPAYQIRFSALSDPVLAGAAFPFRGDRYSTVFPDQVRTNETRH
ncbi:hypothetical protein ACIGXM_14835, partial [Kitasatospora sp. NPDC052896]|uniref:hypothetical protein n=1 Tax=Kitasatospora sp. NPDC052896 TaxID=3364061 RepID=UPI0037C7F67B